LDLHNDTSSTSSDSLLAGVEDKTTQMIAAIGSRAKVIHHERIARHQLVRHQMEDQLPGHVLLHQLAI